MKLDFFKRLACRGFTALAIAALMSVVGGCSSRVSMDHWQRSLQQYASTQSNDDMSFLRDPDHDDVHVRFAVIGDPQPDKSTDVAGVLLGRRTIEGRNWIIFLVAQVSQRETQDIRVAMISDEPGSRQWIVSEEHDASVLTYQRHHDSRWRQLHPDRSEPPLNPGLFPRDEDAFRLEVTGRTVTVVEENSGARWTLQMPGRR